MSGDIRITPSPTGKRLLITTPYNAEFVAELKEIGGTWKGDKRAWSVDARDEERVRALMRAHFGTDGSPEDAAVLVTVRIPLAYYELAYHDGAKAEFAGRVIANRPGRDDPVRLGKGVVLVAGELPRSGGSTKYPEINAGPDVWVEVRDLPRSVLEMYDGGYEIVSEKANPGAPETDQLRARREELLSQVTELNGLLRELDPEGEAQREEETLRQLAGDVAARLKAEHARDKNAAIRELVLDQQAQGAEEERARQARDAEEERRRTEIRRLPLDCRCGTHTCPPDAPTAQQYAANVGRSMQTVLKWCRDEKIAAIRHGGRWYVTGDDS